MGWILDSNDDLVWEPEDGADNGTTNWWDSGNLPTENDVLPIGQRTEIGGGMFATRNSDGSVTYQDPDGQTYTKNASGTYTTQYLGENVTYDPNKNGFVDTAGNLIQGGLNASVAGTSLLDKIKSAVEKNPLKSAVTGAAGLYQLYKAATDAGGYNKPVQKMEAIRQQVPSANPNERVGAYGRQYFTDTQFIPAGDAGARAAALENASAQSAGIQALQPKPAATTQPWANKTALATPWEKPAATIPAANTATATMPSIPAKLTDQGGIPMASGGIASMARGGRYLPGDTDGMADKINTSIDDQQPAKLSHGEFVIPADVVSHMGNGNSEAGAKKLYEMMARIRKARTGNPEQGKRINPDKYMPGGIVGLATGGQVKGFDGTTGSTVSSGVTGAGSPGVPLDTSKTSTLSPWVGDYVTNALGQGQALASAPYQAYTGPLTAGPSDLQSQAFAGASNLATTGYSPGEFSTGTFTADQASKYMNPFLSAALDPQMKELKRQAEIKRLADAGRLTQAGAYGGSRQAIMESEGARNLLDLQNKALGEGYATAYDKAMAQFNAEQGRQMEAQKAGEQSRQYGADFGLKSLQELGKTGATQRDIEQQGLEAAKKQFEEQRDWQYKMPQYQLNLLQGLPISAQTSATNQTGLNAILSNTAGLASLYQTLKNLGIE